MQYIIACYHKIFFFLEYIRQIFCRILLLETTRKIGRQALICIKFFLPKRYFGINKNDLHPRWSNDGKSIVVDVAFSGKREIMILKKNEIF